MIFLHDEKETKGKEEISKVNLLWGFEYEQREQ